MITEGRYLTFAVRETFFLIYSDSTIYQFKFKINRFRTRLTQRDKLVFIQVCLFVYSLIKKNEQLDFNGTAK